MSGDNPSLGDIVRRMAVANDVERHQLALQLEAVRAKVASVKVDEEEAAISSAILADKFPLSVAHIHHTAETDWMDDVVPRSYGDGGMHREAKASATDWFRRISSVALSDDREFSVQVEGAATRWASQFGLDAPFAKQSFIDQVSHLRWAENGSSGQGVNGECSS